jgi:hypothetical protein
MASIKLFAASVGDLLAGNIDWVDDDIYVMLLTSGYTPDQEADSFVSGIDADEVSGAGYTAGGKQLTTPTATLDSPSHTWVYTADDLVWAGCSFTFQYAVIYRLVGSATPDDDNLIAYIDFGDDRVLSSETLTLDWNAAGIIRLGYL